MPRIMQVLKRAGIQRIGMLVILALWVLSACSQTPALSDSDQIATRVGELKIIAATLTARAPKVPPSSPTPAPSATPVPRPTLLPASATLPPTLPAPSITPVPPATQAAPQATSPTSLPTLAQPTLAQPTVPPLAPGGGQALPPNVTATSSPIELGVARVTFVNNLYVSLEISLRGPSVRSFSIGERGRFTVEIQPGLYEVKLSARGYIPQAFWQTFKAGTYDFPVGHTQK